jgi:nucleotide-binding universal stress UspA family protein
LDEAGNYLENHGVRATLVQKDGPVAQAILETAGEYDNDLILMGGYGYRLVREVVLGSAVDAVLRASQQPVLICQ